MEMGNGLPLRTRMRRYCEVTKGKSEVGVADRLFDLEVGFEEEDGVAVCVFVLLCGGGEKVQPLVWVLMNITM